MQVKNKNKKQTTIFFHLNCIETESCHTVSQKQKLSFNSVFAAWPIIKTSNFANPVSKIFLFDSTFIGNDFN